MPRIVVETRQSPECLAHAWQDFAARAPANVFLHPSALETVNASGFARLQVLAAWLEGGGSDRLVGLWAMQRRTVAPLWPTLLATPPYDYAFISNPMIDPAHGDAVMAAMLNGIATDPALPKVMRLKYLDASTDSYPALLAALAAQGSQVLTLSERERPYVAGAADLKRSGSTRKKLRQDWNRLSAQGAVEVVNDREPAAVAAAFEAFLALERDSWKGGRGTALLSRERDAAFARQLIGNLARQQSASVALLRTGDQTIASQVLLYCGDTAYTWKTAFDTAYAKYSPGALLVDKVTDLLLATPGIAAIESCSPEGGFMAQMWAGRRKTVDLLLDVRSRRSVGFVAARMEARGYAGLKQARDRMRAAAATLTGYLAGHGFW